MSTRVVFNADEEQLYLMFKNAVAASSPVGMGMLHHDPNYELSKEDFERIRLPNGKGYAADYVRGRMVKLYVTESKIGEHWTVGAGLVYEDSPTPEYQSFYGKYPTWESLLGSAGITDWKRIEV